MNITVSYGIRMPEASRHEFTETVKIYTGAVRFLIGVMLDKWNVIADFDSLKTVNYIEPLIHRTNDFVNPEYDFDGQFYKFPSYLRRSAIAKARGMVSSYKSHLALWEMTQSGRVPSVPNPVFECPAFYRDNMYIRDGQYYARLKVYTGRDWVYRTYRLRKSDVDYIGRRCKDCKESAPTLRRKGRNWEFVFAYTRKQELCDTELADRTILSVDLGLNHACVCTAMRSDGTVLGRHFYKTPADTDRLKTAVNRIKKAQQHGARRTPRLWGRARGINTHIGELTAQFIIDAAVLYNADVIVMEHLDLNGRKHGSKKQRLHLWRAKGIQSIVACRAHQLGMRISHVCARNTSKLAYDGSGEVQRGTYMVNGAEKYNYGICVFQNGKQYNCDLNAAYNIGARYFIREILKSLPETARSAAEAEVPQLAARSTCTLSSLISLNAVLAA